MQKTGFLIAKLIFYGLTFLVILYFGMPRLRSPELPGLGDIMQFHQFLQAPRVKDRLNTYDQVFKKVSTRGAGRGDRTGGRCLHA